MYTILKTIWGIIPKSVKDEIWRARKYSIVARPFKKKECLVFLIDGETYHGGFCDRMKGAISLFHYCLIKQVEYKIYYVFPFHLSDYLLPNQYNWTINSSELCQNYFGVKCLNLISDPTIKRLNKLNPKRQIHSYANRDIVDELNKEYGTSFSWGQLFQTLFKPTNILLELIDLHKLKLGNNYVSVAFRFQNMLGDFKEYNYPELSDSDKKYAIKKNKSMLTDIVLRYPDKKVLVTSDSILFLQNITDIENTYVIPIKGEHLDNTTSTSSESHMKVFLDFFLLSESAKIYSVGTKEMYKTDFPLYASKIKNVPFERIIT
jgi:hypothetical protein